MSRDPEKLKVFELADALVSQVYTATLCFPAEERYELRSQIRRAAVSVPTNIVEGCARRTERDYLHFLSIAQASAAETRYLLKLSVRLGFLDESALSLAEDYERLLRSLSALITSLESRSS